MISIPIQKIEDAITLFSDEIKKQRKQAKSNLETLRIGLDSALNNTQKDYLDKIIPLFTTDEIIIGKPLYLETQKSDIQKIPVVLDGEHGVKNLSSQIIKKLGYKTLRTSFYPKYFKKVGIKACVYCNSQHTLSVVRRRYNKKGKDLQSKISAKFQVDHYHNKDEYPFLSISLYNLYPSCASCNGVKSKVPVPFELYSDIVSPSRYSFKLASGSLAKYLLDKKKEDIKTLFIDPDKPNPIEEVKGSFQDTFNIQGIYDTQKDIVEEMIVKAQVYNESYKKELMNSFPDLFGKPGLPSRFFLGNYSDPKDIHKRPLSKFMQDIARELGLIE